MIFVYCEAKYLPIIVIGKNFIAANYFKSYTISLQNNTAFYKFSNKAHKIYKRLLRISIVKKFESIKIATKIKYA